MRVSCTVLFSELDRGRRRIAGVAACTVGLLLAGAARGQAPAPAILNIAPTPNTTTAPVAANVAVRFNQPLDNTATTQQALRVFSQQAGGNKAGLTTISGTTLTFNPTTDFKAGETVSATVTTAVRSSNSGQNLATSRVVQFTTGTAPSPGTFGISQAIRVNDTPSNVAAGDIDGDGDLDVVASTPNGASIRVNNGGGSFSGTQAIALGNGYSVYNVTLGDVDNDGDLDMLLSYYGTQHTVSIWLNNGQGVFTNGQNVPGGQYDQKPVLGDIDGDGDLDFVVYNYNPSTPLVFSTAVRLNNGNGTFTNGPTVSIGGVPALGDVDDDGDLDLLVANSTNVNVLANNGAGVFSLRQQVTVGAGPTSIALGDLDDDGDLDVVTANGNALPGVVSVRLNNGSGLFAGGSDVPMALRPVSIVLGDLDGDGDLDFATANNGNGLSWRFNNGSASFSGGSEVATSNDFIRNLTTGDVDADGDLDIVATSNVNGGSTVSVYLNQPAPTITSLSRTSGPAGVSVTVAGTSLLGTTRVTFNGVNASFTQISGTLLSAVVPAGATTGPVVVTTSVGSSPGVLFTVTQDLDVVALQPARNAVAAPRRASVAVTLNKPLGSGFNLQQGLRVFSQQAGGRKAGSATVSGSTLTFDPTTDFAAGETVYATVTQAVQSSTGQALVRPQVFQFTTATVPSAGSFLTDSDVPVGSQPFRVATGDIDGDGDLDMLVAKRSGTTVSVRRNDGSANFGGNQEIVVAGLPISLALGDVDGDGDLDLVTGNTGNTISVRLNDGSGTFGGTQNLATRSSNATSIVLGDVDGDGDLDLLNTGGPGNNAVSVNLNDGSGTFANASEVRVDPFPTVLRLGDLDNDGDLDLVTISNSSTITLRFNDGNGSFSGNQQLVVGLFPNDLALGDIDGDGDLDLLVMNSSAPAAVSVRVNDGTGNFVGNQQVAVASSPTSLVLGDVDGDGDLDLLTSSYNLSTSDPASSRISLRLNNGSGIFGGGATQALGIRPDYLALGDLDNDGDLDLLSANASSSNTVGVHLNQGTALLVTSVAPVRNARAVARTTPVAVTFNQDLSMAPATQTALKVFSQQAGGLLPGTALVRGNTLSFAPSTTLKPGETVSATLTTAAQSNSNQRLANPQVIQFTAATAPAPGTFNGGTNPAVASASAGVAVGDVDGDGDLDLVTASSVRLNDGAGNFSIGASITLNGNPRGITLGDVDGDGDLDLLVAANTGLGVVNVRLNNGQGVFSGTQQVLVGFDPIGVVVGDVDGDGDLDLLSANYASGTVSVRLNNGSGVFAGAIGGGSSSLLQNVAVAPRPITVALGDIDNDGDLDLVAATSLGTTVSVRLNDGGGTFSGNQEVAASFNPYGVALGDMDGDGDLDLLVANLNNYTLSGAGANSVVTVSVNDGNGIFTGSQEVSVGRGARGVAASDVDGDGDLDIVAANAGNAAASFGTVSVRLNNGAGSFTGTQEVTVGTEPTSVALADLDGDGDVDLVTGNSAAQTASVRFNQLNAPVTVAYRLNSGGPALQTSRGLFAPDQFYGANTDSFTTTAAVAGTADPVLYQSERYSTRGVLNYALPVPNGTYTVVLHFAEIYWTQPGQRVFNIELEGSTVRTNFDIVAKVGPLTATTETFTVQVTDGTLNLDLRVPYGTGGADQAKLSGLEVFSPASGSRLLATQPGKAAVSQLSVYPNPTPDGHVRLRYTTTVAQAGTLTLVDQLGRTVHEQPVQLQAGVNQMRVQPAQVRAGLYQLVLRTADGQHLSQKLVVQP